MLFYVVSHVISCLCTLFLWYFCFETVFLLILMFFNVYPFSMFKPSPDTFTGGVWVGQNALSFAHRFDYILLLFIVCIKTFFLLSFHLRFVLWCMCVHFFSSIHKRPFKENGLVVTLLSVVAFIKICCAYLMSKRDRATEREIKSKRERETHTQGKPEPKSCLCVG